MFEVLRPYALHPKGCSESVSTLQCDIANRKRSFDNYRLFRLIVLSWAIHVLRSQGREPNLASWRCQLLKCEPMAWNSKC